MSLDEALRLARGIFVSRLGIGKNALVPGERLPTPQHPPSTVLEEFRQALGSLVNGLLRDSSGALDLAKVLAKSFSEFQQVIQDQAALNDGFSFRNPYEKLLKKEKYLPLLKALYERGYEGAKDVPSQEVELRELFAAFQSELIEIDADKFVQGQFNSDAGRAKLRHILGDTQRYGKNARSELVKAIARAGDREKVAAFYQIDGVTDQISLWNYFNISVTEEELSKATLAAEDILSAADFVYARANRIAKKEAQDKEYIGLLRPEEAGRVISHADLEAFEKLAQEKSELKDPVSQAQAHLAQLWVLAAKDSNWTHEAPGMDKGRGHILRNTVALLKRSESIQSESQLKLFNEKLQEFLQDPIFGVKEVEASPWEITKRELFEIGKHHVVGNGLEELFSEMPQHLKGPYEQILSLSNRWKYSWEMGEKVRIEAPQKPEASYLNTDQQRSIDQLCEALEKTKQELWQGYKQHKAISRLGSQIANLAGEGNIAEIQRANQEIDRRIAALRRVDSKESIQSEVQALYESLKKDGVLYAAFAAAEMDGTEQLLGLVQTVAVTIGMGMLTKGAGWVVEADAALLRVAMSARGLRMLQGFAMGLEMSVAENAIAVASGEARQGHETVAKWLKDAVATGLSMTVTAAAPLSEAAKRSLIQNALARYTVGGIKAVKHLLVDSGLEAVEELIDQYARQALDGKTEALTWNEVSEIIAISLAGGGAKIGSAVEAVRVRQKGKSLEEKKQEVVKEAAPARLITSFSLLPQRFFAGLGIGLATLLSSGYAEASVPASAESHRTTGGKSRVLDYGALLSGGLAMALARRKKERASLPQDPEIFPLMEKLRGQGRRAGEAGRPLSELLDQVQDPFFDPTDPEWKLLEEMRNGEVKSHRGLLKTSLEKIVQVFTQEAMRVLALPKVPEFLKKIARVWVQRAGKSGDLGAANLVQVEEAARKIAVLLKRYLSLGRSSGLAESLLVGRLHVRDIASYVAMQGWLDGTVSRLRGSGEDGIAILLEANRGSVITRALSTADLGYPQKVLEALPRISRELDRAIAEDKEDQLRQILAANRGSIVNRALNSADLEYPARAIVSLPAMLDRLRSGIAQEKDESLRNILRANMGSILHRALHSGDLEYPQKVLSEFPELIHELRLGVEGTKEEAIREVLEANIGTIASRALNRGDFSYPKKVLHQLPRVLKEFEDALAKMEDPSARQVLLDNRGIIVSQALGWGGLAYPAKVIAALPQLLADFEASIANSSNRALQEVLIANRATILGFALHSGRFHYIHDVLAGLPRMMAVLEEGMAKAGTEPIRKTLQDNRASILIRALATGRFEYPQEAVAAVPTLLQGLDEVIASEKTASVREVLVANYGNIVHRALRDGIYSYPGQVQQKLPKILRAMDEEISQVADPELQQRMKSVRRTALHLVLNKGHLDEKVQKIFARAMARYAASKEASKDSTPGIGPDAPKADNDTEPAGLKQSFFARGNQVPVSETSWLPNTEGFFDPKLGEALPLLMVSPELIAPEVVLSDEAVKNLAEIACKLVREDLEYWNTKYSKVNWKVKAELKQSVLARMAAAARMGSDFPQVFDTHPNAHGYYELGLANTDPRHRILQRVHGMMANYARWGGLAMDPALFPGFDEGELAEEFPLLPSERYQQVLPQGKGQLLLEISPGMFESANGIDYQLTWKGKLFDSEVEEQIPIMTLGFRRVVDGYVIEKTQGGMHIGFQGDKPVHLPIGELRVRDSKGKPKNLPGHVMSLLKTEDLRIWLAKTLMAELRQEDPEANIYFRKGSWLAWTLHKIRDPKDNTLFLRDSYAELQGHQVWGVLRTRAAQILHAKEELNRIPQRTPEQERKLNELRQEAGHVMQALKVIVSYAKAAKALGFEEAEGAFYRIMLKDRKWRIPHIPNPEPVLQKLYVFVKDIPKNPLIALGVGLGTMLQADFAEAAVTAGASSNASNFFEYGLMAFAVTGVFAGFWDRIRRYFEQGIFRRKALWLPGDKKEIRELPPKKQVEYRVPSSFLSSSLLPVALSSTELEAVLKPIREGFDDDISTTQRQMQIENLRQAMPRLSEQDVDFVLEGLEKIFPYSDDDIQALALELVQSHLKRTPLSKRLRHVHFLEDLSARYGDRQPHMHASNIEAIGDALPFLDAKDRMPRIRRILSQSGNRNYRIYLIRKAALKVLCDYYSYLPPKERHEAIKQVAWGIVDEASDISEVALDALGKMLLGLHESEAKEVSRVLLLHLSGPRGNLSAALRGLGLLASHGKLPKQMDGRRWERCAQGYRMVFEQKKLGATEREECLKALWEIFKLMPGKDKKSFCDHWRSHYREGKMIGDSDVELLGAEGLIYLLSRFEDKSQVNNFLSFMEGATFAYDTSRDGEVIFSSSRYFEGKCRMVELIITYAPEGSLLQKNIQIARQWIDSLGHSVWCMCNYCTRGRKYLTPNENEIRRLSSLISHREIIRRI